MLIRNIIFLILELFITDVVTLWRLKITIHQRSLRKITAKIKDIYPHLTPAELICCNCRLKIYKMPSRLANQQKTPDQSEGKIIIFL